MAVFAVAHKILVIAYSILKTGTPYQKLGDCFDKLHPERTARRLIKRLERLGIAVTVNPMQELNPRSCES